MKPVNTGRTRHEWHAPAMYAGAQSRLDRMDDEYFDLEMSSDLDALMRTVISG